MSESTDLIEEFQDVLGPMRTEIIDNAVFHSRTLKQNRALHLYLTNLANALDDAGIDLRHAIQVPIRPTMENIKENMWKAIQMALYPEIESSKELSTKQMTEVYENLNRAVATRYGVHVSWPEREWNGN